MVFFLDCSWLKRKLEDSLEDVIQAKDEEMIKELVMRLLEYYSKQSDNDIDDMVVQLVRTKLLLATASSSEEEENEEQEGESESKNNIEEQKEQDNKSTSLPIIQETSNERFTVSY